MATQELTSELLLAAYATGYFPMAEHRDSPEIYWYTPDPRAIFPLESFHVPKSLKKALRKEPFEIRINTAFPEVIKACAARKDTWINDAIINAYTALWKQGFAHSVECWRTDKLLGGLYGIALGGAFFGESMFSRAPNASKAALVHLAGHLRACGYQLLDAQYVNPHLQQFGITEIPRADYLQRLESALHASPDSLV